MPWGYAKYRELYLTGYQLIIHYSKVIRQLLTENLPQWKSLFPNVLICNNDGYSVKPGDIWMLTSTFLILSIGIVNKQIMWQQGPQSAADINTTSCTAALDFQVILWCLWQLGRLPQRLVWLSEPLCSAPGPPRHSRLFYCSCVSNLISKKIIYSFSIILTSLSFSLYLIEFIAPIYREFQRKLSQQKQISVSHFREARKGLQAL